MAENASSVVMNTARAQQPQLVAQFKNAITHNQLAHAFLFAGPAGRGQLEVATWLAMRLLCEHPTTDGDPDGTCINCVRIANGEHPDVLIVRPEGKSLKIDQIRALKDEFSKKAVESNQKVFIIVGADTMTTSAANGLLKFMEEPAGPQTAILLAEHRSQMLPTIISRTQVIEFNSGDTAHFEKSLLALGYKPEQIKLVCQLTDSIQEAEEWMVDNWFSEAQGAVTELVMELLQQKTSAISVIQMRLMALAKTPEQQSMLLDMFAQAWRDQMMRQLMSNYDVNFVDITQTAPMTAVMAILDKMTTARQRRQLNVNFQTVMEALVLEAQFILTK